MKDFKVYQTSGMLNFLVSEASDVRKKEQTLSGNIVSFSTDVQVPIKIIVDIDSTGWTGANMAVAGVNIAPSSVPSNVIAGTFNATDSKIYSAANARVFAFPVPKNATINVQKKSDSTSSHTIALGDTGDIAVNTPVYSPQGFTNINSATLTTGSHSWLYVQSANLTVANELFSIDEFMVILGSSRVDYKAPQGTTHSVTFPNGVGTVTDGTLTIDYDGSVTLETGGQTYTLTSVSPIETLIGDNNIWADAGPVSVTYPI